MSALIALVALPAWAVQDRLAAQDVPQGRLAGQVVNAATQQPIQGAAVRVDATALSTVTDGTGSFDLPIVPPGVYSLTVRAIGFLPYVLSDVVIGSGKPLTVRVPLTPQAIRLEAVEVRPSYFQPPTQAVTSTQDLGAEDVRRAPGVQEDVVRAVALLPGVAVTAAGRNDLIVRGGAPYENLFVVDGIEVPNINHFGSQGSTGGPLSLINIDLVQDVAFSSGGMAAKWGDRTASFTNITLRDGNDDVLSGEVNLSATGFGAIAEGPLGRSGSFLMSARRSYLDLLFKAAGFSFIPAYWDFQLKTTHRIDAANTISFLGIGALNSVTFTNETADDRYDNSRILSPEQNQYFAGLSWRHFLDRGLLTVTLGRTYTRFRSVQRDSLVPPNDILRSFSTEGENSLRADLVLQPTSRLELDVGSVSRFASKLDYDVFVEGFLRIDDEGVPRPLAVDTSFTAFRTAVYAEARYWVTSGARVTAGLRGNYYGFLAESFRLAPRVGLRLEPSTATALSLSYGRTYQAPSYIWLVGDPGNRDSLGPTRADQAVLGLEHRLRDDLKLQIETYYKAYGTYPARIFRPQAVLAPSGFEDATTDIPFGLEPLDDVGEGRAYGVEVFLQKRLSAIPVYGLVSVAVSRSEFRAVDTATRPGAYDGRVIANLLAGWRINRGWEVSGKFRLATGLPTTPFIQSGPEAGRLDFARYNAGPRLPTFHALDVRVDRRWSFRGWQLDLYLDVQNVYGRKNVSQYIWNPRTGETESNDSLGILPTIGVNVEF
ncbi:MAG: TonB-dependent receptor [Gemmatimonadales bacterium]|nr:TonB-dependent receptor [Gemmatimonadales bacterium]